MNLQEIRNALREQMDLPDEEDISTSLLDSFIAEGYNEVINRRERWPFFETTWTLASTADGEPVALPSTLSSIDSVRRASDGMVLMHVPFDDAEEQFEDETGVPFMFSTWGNEIWFWPRAEEVETYTIRGWRLGSDAWTSGAANEPDTAGERRLDRAIVHYAMYRAFQQQEDPELAADYYAAFERHVQMAIEAIIRPIYHGKTIVGSGLRAKRRRRMFWNVD